MEYKRKYEGRICHGALKRGECANQSGIEGQVDEGKNVDGE